MYSMTIATTALTAVISHTRPPTIFFLFQKLRFGGRQSNVSMEITASRVTGTTISIVNSQRIRVALSSLLEWMNYKNLTAKLLGLSLPFYYWQSHLPHGSADSSLCTQFASTLETLQDRSLDYVLARRMTRISATKIVCIHNKLIKSQSSHKATHFRGQLFQLPGNLGFFDFLFRGSLTASSSFVFVQSKRRLLHKRFARKECFCYLIQRQTTFSPHNNPPSQRNCK